MDYLLGFPKENKFLEFKHNNGNPNKIGELMSALSNGACLKNEPFGYLVFGIENETKKVLGTRNKTIQMKKLKVKN